MQRPSLFLTGYALGTTYQNSQALPRNFQGDFEGYDLAWAHLPVTVWIGVNA